MKSLLQRSIAPKGAATFNGPIGDGRKGDRSMTRRGQPSTVKSSPKIKRSISHQGGTPLISLLKVISD